MKIKLKFYNKFSHKKKYSIYLASKKDIKSLLNFIDEYWKKNHIFVKSKKLFKFQHLGRNKLNWVLAKNKNSRKIEGILGLVSKNFFSKGIICKKDDLWITMIMVAYPLNPSKGLGTEMIKFFYKKFNPNSISAIGINKKVSKLYKKIGLNINYLNHYYIKKNKNYTVLNNFKNNEITGNFRKIKYFKNFDQPYKMYNYYLNRYFKHPIYKYHLLIIYKENKINNFLVFRKINYNKKIALRIIDVANVKLIKNFSKENFDYLISYFKANYLDFLNFGIKKNIFKKIGFLLRDKNTFIPHHFEPYEKKNIDVMVASISCNNNFYIFKGDSDLDRPSII